MYAALWRHLPGPALLRLLICLLLVAVVVAVCFAWVFPWVASLLPVNDPSVTGLGVPRTGPAGLRGPHAA